MVDKYYEENPIVLDYNTEREKLSMPEYGRNVLKMVEEVKAAAGMDIGGTLIGMHLRRVAVPVRLSLDHIGEAILLCARTRPPFIGGSRAVYSDTEVR